METESFLKVTVHVSDDMEYRGAPLAAAILDFLFFRGVIGATVLKGVAGFGADHRMHSASSVDVADRLPLRIEFVAAKDKAEALMPELQEMTGNGTIEVQETTVIKPAVKTLPAEEVHVKIEGRAKMMKIFFGESDQWQGKPLYEALVMAMRANDIAGVTVERGIMGYGAHRRVHKDKPLRLSRDASIVMTAVDTEEKLKAFLPVVEQMVFEGLVTFSDVDVFKYVHRPVGEV